MKKEKIELVEIKFVEDFVKSKMKIKLREVDIEEKVFYFCELEKIFKEDEVVKSV